MADGDFLKTLIMEVEQYKHEHAGEIGDKAFLDIVIPYLKTLGPNTLEEIRRQLEGLEDA